MVAAFGCSGRVPSLLIALVYFSILEQLCALDLIFWPEVQHIQVVDNLGFTLFQLLELGVYLLADCLRLLVKHQVFSLALKYGASQVGLNHGSITSVHAYLWVVFSDILIRLLNMRRHYLILDVLVKAKRLAASAYLLISDQLDFVVVVEGSELSAEHGDLFVISGWHEAADLLEFNLTIQSSRHVLFGFFRETDEVHSLPSNAVKWQS